MRRGYIFLEILMGVALAGLVFVGAVAMFGDMRLKMQERQLESAARHFMADCRMVQQSNMFRIMEDKIGEDRITNQLLILAGYDKEYYVIDTDMVSTDDNKIYLFSDMGCKGVYFDNVTEIIRFSALGSVGNSAYILLKHRDNDKLELLLNLQPVTGRIEIESFQK